MGYRAWTPLVMKNGVRVMVDRGWIPRPEDAGGRPPNPTAPSGVVRVLGYWRDFPQPGLTLGATGNRCGGPAWPKTLSYPDAEHVACQYGQPVAKGLMLLDSDAPGGFVRKWDIDRIGLPLFAHYAYAVQWFLMAGIACVILVIVNTRRHPT